MYERDCIQNESVKLCDYSQAGKNYDEENCEITVWQDMQ